MSCPLMCVCACTLSLTEACKRYERPCRPNVLCVYAQSQKERRRKTYWALKSHHHNNSGLGARLSGFEIACSNVNQQRLDLK